METLLAVAQAVEPNNDGVWTDSEVLWVALVLLIAMILVFLFTQRPRS